MCSYNRLVARPNYLVPQVEVNWYTLLEVESIGCLSLVCKSIVDRDVNKIRSSITKYVSLPVT